MQVGIPSGEPDISAYSSARQLVTIPTGGDTVTLTFWLYPWSAEGGLLNQSPFLPGDLVPGSAMANDSQYVLVLNEAGTILEQLLWIRSDARRWRSYDFDMSEYAGDTIKLHFGTHNDGYGGVTGMYVDDVSLEVCD